MAHLISVVSTWEQYNLYVHTYIAPASTISKLVEKQRQELEDQVMSLKAEIEVLEEELSKRSRHGGGEDGGDGDNADTKLKRTMYVM